MKRIKIHSHRGGAAMCCMLTVPLLQGLAAAQGSTTQAELPVKRVTLYTSGVAFTERLGTITGNATVPLNFPVGQINDILKSIVLIDSTGKVQPATYASKDPLERTLQSFAVDLSEDLSRDDLLGKLRGTRVQVDEQGKPPVLGQLLGVETTKQEDGKPPVYLPSHINLLTDAGIVSLTLNPGTTVRILDARINSEIRSALAALAGGVNSGKRSVQLHFAGNGKRNVRVAYVTEAPLWKISYRLVLGGQSGKDLNAKAYLQGWALVENMTDEDWKGVHLTLISGRPISFIQDLYQPLYLERPEVGPDVAASPTPQTHDSGIVQAPKPAVAAPMQEEAQKQMAGKDAAVRFARKAEANVAGEPGSSGASAADTAPSLPVSDLRSSVHSQAGSSRVGTLFQYSVLNPINLSRQQAAMIPVITKDVSIDRLSIYNADTDGDYALNAIRLHPGAAMHLKAGPITLFDGGNYAGDARIEDTQPGEARLITYAVDSQMHCHKEDLAETGPRVSVTVHRGIIKRVQRERVETLYRLASSSDKPRIVLVEYPINAGYNLISPSKTDERTDELYRFSVTVPAKGSRTLRIVTERPVTSSVTITSDTQANLATYATGSFVSEKLKAQLKEALRRRAAVDELRSRAKQAQTGITEIKEDQDRIRNNMNSLDRNSSLYKRYVAELDAQETKIQAIRQSVSTLNREAAAAEISLRQFEDSIGE